MSDCPNLLDFRQRATAYVLRHLPGRETAEVLVIIHRDEPGAGIQVPGGGAHATETVGEAAVREAYEETGAHGLALGEVIGSLLMVAPEFSEGHQISTYSWLRTEEIRDTWDHEVVGGDGDHGFRFRCEFRPVASAGIDWGMDCFLDQAVERFTTACQAPIG